ncbi:MAG: rhomboid family intramembrane serine protease [Muribaculaceae bacterium]|nr:rhomboid family intramembrane serine protease [Muribaculaceae bacterium]
MANSILNTLFKRSSLLTRLIVINVAVWLVVSIALVVCFLFKVDTHGIQEWLAMSSNFTELGHHPWTVITYMFVHFNVWHILFNVLWLWWMGRIFVAFFRPKQLGGLYFLGGLGGAALFLLACNTLPVFADSYFSLVGASASVMAIAVGIAVYAPNFEIGILFFGRIKIKWLAIVMVVIDIVSIYGLSYEGHIAELGAGHIAHLGGALTGVAWAIAMRHGHDLTAGPNRLLDWFVSLFKRHEHTKRSRMGTPIKGGASTTFHYHPDVSDDKATTSGDEARLDEILGKLKQSGYDALSDEEKEFLFSASRKR